MKIPVKVILLLTVNEFSKNGWSDNCVQSTHGVELSSSLEYENRTAACPGESVIYTCTVANTGVLQWAVESFHTFEGDSIILTVEYDAIGKVVQEQGGLLLAILKDKTGEYIGNITSTLTILAHNHFDNKKVWCGNGFVVETESPCILHTYGVSPSAPVSSVYTITSFEISSVSLQLEWERPQSDGGLGISNYTTTLRGTSSQHIYNEMGYKLFFKLLYMEHYSLQLYAANCAGYSPPVNISIEDIAADTSYQELQDMCILASTPLLPPHAHIENESSIFGSIIVYKCDSGYEPAETMVAKCLTSGEWEPNITALECTKQVDCGIPEVLSNVSVYYTTTKVGSMAVIQCDKGLVLQNDESQVVKCNRNGSWIPNPSNYKCVHIPGNDCTNSNGPDIHLYRTLLIIVGALLLITLSLGILLGSCCLILHQIKTKPGVTRQYPHTYDEVMPRKEPQALNVVKNEAYCHGHTC